MGAWSAAAAAVIVLGGAAVLGSVLLRRDAAPPMAPARSAPSPAPAPVAEAPAVRANPPPDEAPTPAANEGGIDMGRLAPPPAANPPPSLASDGSSPSMEFTVPPGTTLTELLQQLYGQHFPSADGQALLAEVQRLNPRIKDVDMILAGQVLHLPPRPR